MEDRTVKTYDYEEVQAFDGLGYEWSDSNGNILSVPDDSWDPALNNEKGRNL